MTNVYEVLINDEKIDTLLVTNKDLSCIDIVDVLRPIKKVNTYTYFKDEYENDFYRINGVDIVSFSVVDSSYSNVTIDIAKYTKEQKKALEELSDALNRVSELAKDDNKFSKEIVSAKLERVWEIPLYKMINDVNRVIEDMEVE